MSNYWGHKPNFKIPPLGIGIIIIGIIGFLLFPNLFSNIYPLANSTSALSESNNLNQSNANSSDTLNSSSYQNQISSNVNTLISGNGNNELSTGYWVLFVYNSTFQQLSINAQDYAFLQNLINNDGKSTPVNPVFLVENGQIQKYVVGNEINSVISNLATIYKRSSTTGQTPSTSNTATPDTTSPSTTSPSTTSPSTTSPSTTSPSTTSPSTTSPNSSSSSSNSSQNSAANISP